MNKKPRNPQPDPVVAEYSKSAGHYDSRWSFYVKATSRETMARMSVRPTDRLLDAGCGTGALLGLLANAYPTAQLLGVDPVPEMLAVARRKLPPSVELHEGWIERLPFDDGVFDTVVSTSVFHYLRQPVAALGEMRRMLRPGGQLVITDWCSDYLSCRICDRYLRWFSPAHFKVYRRQACLNLLEEAGFPQARIERYRINWLWGMMTARANI